MPTPRSAIAAGVYNNWIIVPGGEMQNAQFLAAFKAVEAYDTAHNTWQILPSMPHQRHGLAVGVVDKRLYAVSGDGQSAGNGMAETDVNYNEALKLDEVLK
jgi:N-acetylneuraminic acid mutarotase